MKTKTLERATLLIWAISGLLVVILTIANIWFTDPILSKLSLTLLVVYLVSWFASKITIDMRKKEKKRKKSIV